MRKESLLIGVLFALISIMPAQGAGIFDKDDPLTIYPNPANEKLFVKVDLDMDRTPEIQILDLTGKIVLRYDKEISRENKLFKAEIDISDLKSGIYFVKVIQDKTAYSKKLIVK